MRKDGEMILRRHTGGKSMYALINWDDLSAAPAASSTGDEPGSTIACEMKYKKIPGGKQLSIYVHEEGSRCRLLERSGSGFNRVGCSAINSGLRENVRENMRILSPMDHCIRTGGDRSISFTADSADRDAEIRVSSTGDGVSSTKACQNKYESQLEIHCRSVAAYVCQR